MRRIFRVILPLVVLIAAVAVALPALATSQVYVPLDVLARQSTAVIRGRIGEATVSRDPRTARPRTHTTLHVGELLWGQAPARLQIVQTRGEIDGVVTQIPSDPELKPGAEVVLFIREVEGRWYLTALDQSLFEIVQQGRATVLRRELSDGLFTRQKDGTMSRLVQREPPVRTLDALRALLARVPTAVKQGGAR